MKQLKLVTCTICFIAMFKLSFAQVVTVTGGTNTTPSLSSSYTSLANAITDLNSITSISGPVIITMNPGNTEFAPAGGYEISFSAITSESNNVVIDGSSSYNSIVSSRSLTSGSTTDAVFKLIGCDFVTIKRFSIFEHPSNTTTTLGTNNMTEWGIALLRSSTSDGAQNNTIEDNNISLSRSYQNSFGIYSNVRHSATAPGTSSNIINGTTAPNHYNKIYNNRISNVSMGIAFIGSSTDSRMDIGNDIGGNSSSTGNEITNWGGNDLVDASFTGNFSEYYGTLVRCQKDVNISWNEIISSTSLSGSSAAPISGIRYGNTTGTVTGSFSISILNNTITITDNLPNGSSSESRVNGISISDKLATGSLYVSNNIISGLAVTTANSNRQIRGIINTASASNVYINNNTIKGNTSTATSLGGWFFGIDQTGTVSDILEINNNLIGESSTTTPAITYSATAYSGTIVRGISNNQSSNATGTLSVSINDNSLYGFVQANNPSNSHVYIYCDHTTTIASEIEIIGNQFINLNANTSGDITFISSPGVMSNGASAVQTISKNRIVGSFTKSIGGGEVYLYRANGNSSTGNSMIESGNDFSNITLTGSTIMRGWYNTEGASAAGPEKSITNNVFENWICGSSGSTRVNVIYCDWASGNSQISGNRIANITAPQDVFGIHSASSTTAVLTMNNNSIDALTTLSASGEMVGAEISALGILSSFHNNVVTNAPIVGGSAIGFRFPVATASTIIDYSYNSIRLNASSSTPTFNSAAIFVTANATATSGQAFIRNNILVNLSTPGSSGRSSAIMRSGGTFANLDPSSDNNVLYVTPGTNRFILYNGTGYATIASYKAALPGGYANTESHSLQQLPSFISATDLHLLPFPANHQILNGGLNNGSALGVDVVGVDMDADPRMTTMPYITDIGADQVSPIYITNVWTGQAGGGDDTWANPNNWSLGTVPDDEFTNAYIPYVDPYPQPYIENIYTWSVANVYFETGVGGIPLLHNNGMLNVHESIVGDAGSFDNYDRFSPSDVIGSVGFFGSTGTQLLGGSIFVNNRVFSFICGNNVTISSLPGDGLKVVGELGFGSSFNKTLNTGASSTGYDQNITLISTAASTAWVSPIDNSNFIDGDVTVERYINTGTGSGQHPKKWQALATPTGANSTGQSVYDSWMEGGNNASTGYGTHIPDPRTNWSALGFDDPAFTTSIQTYNPSGGFDPIANTGIPLYSSNGYFIFVRGDRSIDDITLPSNPTILRSKGALFQPQAGYQAPSVIVPAGLFQMVGNPYASAIDIQFMVNNGYFTNLTNDFIVWDPLLPGTLGLGGYQTISQANGYKPVPGGTTLYDANTVYTEVQSGQAFFVKSPAITGSVSFDEDIKTANNRLVTRPAASSNRKYFRAALYSGAGLCDGNAAIFAPDFKRDIDANDAIKLFNPRENFAIKRGNKALAIETRPDVAAGDTVFYAFSNMDKNAYKIGFAPFHFEGSGLEAVLVDDYLHTQMPISMVDSSFAEFTVTDDRRSYENRYYVVFRKMDHSLNGIPVTIERKYEPSIVVFPNPAVGKQFSIRLSDFTSGSYAVQLTNSMGQVVHRDMLKLYGTTFTTSVNLRKDTPAGSYDLTISDSKGKQWSYKVVIK